MSAKKLIERIHERYASAEAFIRTLKYVLELEGVPQADLARAVGYSPGNVSAWLQGRRVPSLRTLVLLDEAMCDLIGDNWEER